MLDLNFVRDHLPEVEEKLAQRGMNAAEVLGQFRQMDGVRRQHITELETLQAQRNRASEEIARLKKAKQDATVQIAETKELREKIQELEGKAQEEDARLRELLAGIPNMPNAGVPVGKTSEDNVEVRRWGKPPEFSFAPKPHWELGEQLGILDLERAAKLTGARFAVYWDVGARLVGPRRARGFVSRGGQRRSHGPRRYAGTVLVGPLRGPERGVEPHVVRYDPLQGALRRPGPRLGR